MTAPQHNKMDVCSERSALQVRYLWLEDCIWKDGSYFSRLILPLRNVNLSTRKVKKFIPRLTRGLGSSHLLHTLIYFLLSFLNSN